MLNKLFNTVNVTIYYINGTESDTFGKDILLRYWEVITLSGFFFFIFLTELRGDFYYIGKLLHYWVLHIYMFM